MDLNVLAKDNRSCEKSLLSDIQKELVLEFLVFKADIPNRIAKRKQVSQAINKLKLSDSFNTFFASGDTKKIVGVLDKKKAEMSGKLENFNDLYSDLTKLGNKLRKSLESALYASEIDKIINSAPNEIKKICRKYNISLD